MKKFYILVLLAAGLYSGQSSAQIYWSKTASFAGNNTSYVAVPNSATIDITGSFSIEAWINPATLSGTSKGIISKGGFLGTSLKYAVRLNSSGRISVLTNGASRLTSRVSTPLSVNNWTHFSTTYNSATGVFNIYLNGILDTTSTVAAASPGVNSDSLFIGISGSSTPFAGQLDEVRLWNKILSGSDINMFMRTSLGTSSGIYSGLVMSIAFQSENVLENQLKDMSGNGNNAFDRNIEAASPFSNSMAGGSFFRPLHTISQNECLELDGTEDFLAGKDTTALNLDTALTLECWIYPRTSGGCRLISKGNNYGIIYTNGSFNGLINNNIILSGNSIPVSQWSYLAFTYRSSGEYNFFINGINVNTGSLAPANINVTADSIYIGGGPAAIGDLNGYLDEVRITNKAKTQEEIFGKNYASLERSKDPNLIQKNINYSFDGNTLDNIGDGGPRLFFRNNARFSHPGQISNQPVSPLNQDEGILFSKAYYLKTSNNRIPLSGTAGTITDSQNVNLNASITDVNLFVALNHTESSDLDIILIAPNGDSVLVFGNKNTNSEDDNVITVFDDNADSVLLNGRYSSFYAKITPENSMNVAFNGDNAKGFWKIRIRDEAFSNSGTFYSWGLQINETDIRPKNLNLSVLIQGFYDSTSNIMKPDTLSARIIGNGVNKTDKAVIGTDGNCYFSFNPDGSFTNEKSVLLQITHRNSIETWASSSFKFTGSEANIDFMNSETGVLGTNVIRVDNFPVRYAIYGGDVNQNDAVDLTDVIMTFNSSADFTTGYVVTDVTGDNIADLTDVILIFNNSVNFVQSVIP